MKKFLLLTPAIAIIATIGAKAQIVLSKDMKCDARTLALIRTAKTVPASRATATGDTQATAPRFIITATDAHAAADSIRLLGGRATVIADNTVSASLPLTVLPAVARLHSVGHITAARTFRALTNTARTLTGVDKVHAGTGLETPFTGHGVIVGIIDQGFEYRHVAFLDKNASPRVTNVWNHSTESAQPTTDIPLTYDGNKNAGGHATHVTGIAAGSRYEGNPYYGMAPEADIIMVTSTFNDADVLAEAKWIKETAEAEGRPWVINMSFGTQVGPHDGTTDYDRTMSALCGAGGIMAGAMGNEGDENLHVTQTLAKGEEVTLLLDVPTDDYNLVDLWGNATDGLQHLEVTPFVYNAATGKQIELSDAQWAKAGQAGGEINANNKKENYFLYVSVPTVADMAGIKSVRNALIGLRIKGLTEGASFHAWTEPGYGTFIKKNGIGIIGDTNYLVGQAAASIPRAIGVAAYNGASQWVAATNGNTYQYPSSSVTGALSTFSSPGPSLGTDIKPTVAAPGATIASALNRYVSLSGGSTFDVSDVSIVGAADRTTGALLTNYKAASARTNDFYGIMSGTSMATPVVTGIIALWLQANPTLTPEDVADIIRTTAARDNYTGTEEWTAKRGYGKIDAYEGLKLALQRGTASGINPTMTADRPITISREAKAWKVLFNTSAAHANMRLTTLSGTTIVSRTLTDVRPGDELQLSTANLAPGVYIVSIATPQATLTRKLIAGGH